MRKSEQISDTKENLENQQNVTEQQLNEIVIPEEKRVNDIKWKFEQSKIAFTLILIIFLLFLFNLRLYFRLNNAESVIFETLKSVKMK